jgi:hypothetical protein
MNLLSIAYQLSGWLVTGVCIGLAYYALRTKQMWLGKYIYIALLLCFVAFTNVVSSVTALVLTNNLFLEYLLAPTNFTLKALYLRGQHRRVLIRSGMVLLIVIYLAITLFTAFYEDGYKELNTAGVLINRVFFLGVTLWNLTLLFRSQTHAGKLRQHPDFWFTATIFCFAFIGVVFSVINKITYEAKNDTVAYAVLIAENLLDILIYCGFYRGMKLLH